MRRMRLLPLLLVLLLAVIGCERRPLEVHLQETVSVRIVVKWQVNFVELYGSTPNGMTVMVWGSKSTTPIIRTTNSDHVTLKLEPDTYRMVIFNELMDDYAPYVGFFDVNSYDSISQRAAVYSATRAGGQWMYTPEDPRIAVAVDTFKVTPEMVLQDSTTFVPYEEYKENGYSSYKESEHVFEIPETPWPMTVDLYVQLKFRNRHSIRSVNGTISGLAEGFYLSRIVRTTESGIIRFNPDYWDRNKFGDEDDNLGVMTTRLATYGMPFGKELIEERAPADNILNLDIELYNDSVIHRTFEVGKLIHYIKPTGEEARIRYRQDLQHLRLIIELPDTIDLPYVLPPGGAGFDAVVDEWEDGGIFDIGGF